MEKWTKNELMHLQRAQSRSYGAWSILRDSEGTVPEHLNKQQVLASARQLMRETEEFLVQIETDS